MKTFAKGRPRQERGWTWWLIPKPFDLVSTALYLAVLVPFFYNLVHGHGYPIEWWGVILMLCTIITLLSVDRLEYWLYGEETPTRVAVYLLLTRIILIEVVAWLDHLDFSPALYLIVPYLAYLYFGNIVAYCLAAFAWVSYAIQHWLKSPDWLNNSYEPHYFAVFTIGLIFAITIAHSVVKEKASRARAEQLLAELEDSHQQLKTYSEQVAELATTKERNRLARDIHDTLGHYLTVINVQLEKALAFRDKKPLEADQAVSNAKRLASEALGDVRRSVGTLRATQEIPSLFPAITELVKHMQNDQCSVKLTIEGSEEGFSKQGLMALYRAVQEGLTNIEKHANAHHVLVKLHFGDQGAYLSLSDDGSGFEPALLENQQAGQEGGYGLQGLRERLELVGGRLQLESRPGEGTCLCVTIPKDPLERNELLLVQAQKE